MSYRHPAHYRGGFHAMTRDEQNSVYDQHNPGMRHSPDAGERMYGSCGCDFCKQYRATYADAGMPAPINSRGGKLSSVNLCDRCGVMVKGSAVGSVQLRTSSDPDTTEVVSKELCPVCVEEILTQVELSEELIPERAKRGYDKPYVRPRPEDDFDKATAEQMAAALLERLMQNQGRELEGPKTNA